MKHFNCDYLSYYLVVDCGGGSGSGAAFCITDYTRPPQCVATIALGGATYSLSIALDIATSPLRTRVNHVADSGRRNSVGHDRINPLRRVTTPDAITMIKQLPSKQRRLAAAGMDVSELYRNTQAGRSELLADKSTDHITTGSTIDL
jgi:hypothetical protein